MKNMWRISQVGQFLSPFFWAIALTGILWPILKDYLWINLVGIAGVERATLLGLTLIFASFILLFLSFGYFYDRITLWKEQIGIAAEKNPYMREKLSPKEIVLFEMYASTFKLPMLKEWIEKQIKENPKLEEEVILLMEYIHAQEI